MSAAQTRKMEQKALMGAALARLWLRCPPSWVLFRVLYKGWVLDQYFWYASPKGIGSIEGLKDGASIYPHIAPHVHPSDDSTFHDTDGIP